MKDNVWYVLLNSRLARPCSVHRFTAICKSLSRIILKSSLNGFDSINTDLGHQTAQQYSRADLIRDIDSAFYICIFFTSAKDVIQPNDLLAPRS